MAHSFFSFSSYKQLLQALLIPNERQVNVWDIDLSRLRESGYHSIFLDIDNTVLSVHQKQMSLRHLNWIEKCKDLGYKVIILSNNRSKKRIRRICKQAQCEGYYLACKPFPYSVATIAKKHGLSYKDCLVIGDQVFTDIILSNWIKAYSVLVEPIDKQLSFVKRIQYQIERGLLKKLS